MPHFALFALSSPVFARADSVRSLLRCFCGRLQRHLQAWHYVLQRLQRFRAAMAVAVAQPHIPLIGEELAQ